MDRRKKQGEKKGEEVMEGKENREGRNGGERRQEVEKTERRREGRKEGAHNLSSW